MTNAWTYSTFWTHPTWICQAWTNLGWWLLSLPPPHNTSSEYNISIHLVWFVAKHTFGLIIISLPAKYQQWVQRNDVSWLLDPHTTSSKYTTASMEVIDTDVTSVFLAYWGLRLLSLFTIHTVVVVFVSMMIMMTTATAMMTDDVDN